MEEQCHAHGCCDIFEKEYRRKDGAVLQVEIRGGLLRDENGNPCGVWAFVRGMTDRKQAERELKENEAKYRRLSEQLEETVKQKTDFLRFRQADPGTRQSVF